MIGSISIGDINEALPLALPLLLKHGKRHTAQSVANQRPTLEWPGVFITEYTRPMRNVLFDPRRNANPLFHYLEAMWIIAGRNDVSTLAHILPKMRDYSDDGDTFHGAYGYRLRHWPGADGQPFDQIEEAIAILRDKPDTRQVVLSIWDPARDLGIPTKDMPCNDMVMLKIRNGKLNITVNNRSNDTIWGCYGANAVQFSMLQMYLAARIGVGVGTYVQISDSFHVYEDNPYWQWYINAKDSVSSAYYSHCRHHNPYRQYGEANLFGVETDLVDPELEVFWAKVARYVRSGAAGELPMDDGLDWNIAESQFGSQAVHDAAVIWNTLHYHRQGDHASADLYASTIRASDWQHAVSEWLHRRGANK